ncbi:hypothetical protein H4R19_003170, partial [Coemansia spiralis]
LLRCVALVLLAMVYMAVHEPPRSAPGSGPQLALIVELLATMSVGILHCPRAVQLSFHVYKLALHVVGASGHGHPAAALVAIFHATAVHDVICRQPLLLKLYDARHRVLAIARLATGPRAAINVHISASDYIGWLASRLGPHGDTEGIHFPRTGRVPILRTLLARFWIPLSAVLLGETLIGAGNSWKAVTVAQMYALVSDPADYATVVLYLLTRWVVVVLLAAFNAYHRQAKAELFTRVEESIYYALCREAVLAPGSQHTAADLARTRTAAVRPFVSALSMAIGTIPFISGVALSIAVAYAMLGWRIYGVVCMVVSLTLVSKRISAWRTTRLATHKRPGTLHTRLTELLPSLVSFKQLGLEDRLFQTQRSDRFDDHVSLVLAELATSVTKLASGASTYIATSGIMAGHSGTKPQHDVVQLLAILEHTTTSCMGFAKNMGCIWEVVHLEGILAAKLAAGRVDIVRTSLVDPWAPVGIEMSGASFCRSDNGQVAISVDSLAIGPGKLVAVTGAVGAGKSALLLAMLGELQLVLGTSCTRGSVAYVGQSPWIMGGTVEENVLFGRTLDPRRYARALRLACLAHEASWIDGAGQARISDEGTTLSGGQRARLALARAIYADADIYILDDTLSALDARVRESIWNHVVSNDGELRGKIRVVTTNDPRYIECCDVVVHVSNGTACVLTSRPGAAAIAGLFHLAPDIDSSVSTEAAPESNQTQAQPPPRRPQRAELRCTPRQALSHFIGVCGARTLVLAVAMGLATFGVPVLLYQWRTALLSTTTADEHAAGVALHQKYAWSVAVSTAVTILLGWVRLVVQEQLYVTHNRSRLHRALLGGLVHAQMPEIWRIGSHRVLSVVSFSERSVFVGLHSFVEETAAQFAAIAFAAYSTFQISPWALASLVVLGFIMVRAMRHSSNVLLEIQTQKRAEIQQRDTLVHSLFSGALTVRAFQAYDRIETRIWTLGRAVAGFERLASTLMSMRALCVSALQEVLGHQLVGAVALQAGRGPSMGVAGVQMYHDLLAQALPLLQYVVVVASEANNHLLALQEFCDVATLPQEGPRDTSLPLVPGLRVLAGEIEFAACSMRYAPTEGRALDGVSFRIRPGERIGIVGRTGSGKSSLVNALLRIVELESGAVLLDGVDISRVEVHDLRRQISVVPQTEALLAGSLRSNLDPLGKHSDAELWAAARDAGLDALGLDMHVESCGRNLSAGQRQLIALCRALLQRRRIVVFDEATARVDEATAQRIRTLTRDRTAGCTVLTIAHQLDAVHDCDRILVMDGGRVAEFGAPAALVAQQGLYFQLLEAAAGRTGA